MKAEAVALAKHFLGLAKISGNVDRDLQLVDALCTYFANISGAPPLPDQVAPGGLPK